MKSKPIIIAHRGACGYLPEHTLPAKAMAYAMGADFLEQDAVLTKDDRVIVVHDRFLDTVTDVARCYPKRKRIDGRYYAIDFTLKEIKKLRIHERVDHDSGTPVYPGRFPVDAITHFEIPTLEEEIEMIQGMNRSTGKDVGIYVELKGPAFHRREGRHFEEIVLEILQQYGYTTRDSNCFIQCFEPESLIYMRNNLMCDLKMVQLIGDNSWAETPGVDYHTMLTPAGLDGVASYADVIGPWTYPVVGELGLGNEPRVTKLVDWAHERNLGVHVFTFRADSIPAYFNSFDGLLDLFFIKVGVDGIFTDFADLVASFLRRAGLR
jgi:glycerophosphoryl diester phosphodiesterase